MRHATVMGMSELQQVVHLLTLEIIVKCINVGTVIRKENFMKLLNQIILLVTLTVMVLILTSCTSKFDGYDPTTATVRWILTYERE